MWSGFFSRLEIILQKLLHLPELCLAAIFRKYFLRNPFLKNIFSATLFRKYFLRNPFLKILSPQSFSEIIFSASKQQSKKTLLPEVFNFHDRIWCLNREIYYKATHNSRPIFFLFDRNICIVDSQFYFHNMFFVPVKFKST